MPGYCVSPQAEKDLDELARYIAQDNVDAALRLYDMARATYETLAENPMIGNSYPALNAELVGLQFFPIRSFPKYLVFYVASDHTDITVIRVLHGSRKIGALIS